MSAGFAVAGEVFAGTNGAVEAYIEAMAALSTSRFGPDDPLSLYFVEQSDSFTMGCILFLDDWLSAGCRGRLVWLLDAATDQLLRDDAFTDYGREWVATVIAALKDRIAESDATGDRASERGA